MNGTTPDPRQAYVRRAQRRDDKARHHARRDGPVVPVAGIEGAAGAEGGAARRHSRSARDRSGRDQGFSAFLPDDWVRDDRVWRTGGRRAAVRLEETGLREAAIWPL